jgi:hypothetical protein
MITTLPACVSTAPTPPLFYPPLQDTLQRCQAEYEQHLQEALQAGVQQSMPESVAQLRSQEEDPFFAKLRSDPTIARMLDEVGLSS